MRLYLKHNIPDSNTIQIFFPVNDFAHTRLFGVRPRAYTNTAIINECTTDAEDAGYSITAIFIEEE